MMPKLSVVLPVYNVERYIRSCLESLFKQGLDDLGFEVIIVNDGTPDKSMEMIADIINQHHNIIVINQENQGLSVTRNNGLAVARGEYILMLDSDDLLIENSLKPLLDKALETKVDLVVADYISMNDYEIEEKQHQILQQSESFFVEKTGKKIFLEDLDPYHCYVWRTLYRHEFLVAQNLSFFPGIRYEDIPFTHECYLKAKRGIRTNRFLNIYRRWPGSTTITYKIDNAKSFIIAIDLTWRLRHIEGISSSVLYKLEEDVYISFRTWLYHTLHFLKQKTDRNEIMDYLNFHASDIYFSHGILQRLITMMIKRMPHLFINLYYQYAQVAFKNRH
jgi:glycosyltransferase involved in cell wall biosynthesis